MKYFEFNNASIGAIATGWDVDNQCTGNNSVNFTVVALEVEEIKDRIDKMWANKEEFKKLISSFDDLDDVQKINLLKMYYKSSFYGLKYDLIDEYVKEYPVEKYIKTDLIFVVDDLTVNFFKTELKVLAKKGVKLNVFKTYTREDLDKLVEEGKIVVVGYEVGKECKVNGKVDRVDSFVNKFCPDFDELSVEEICEKFPRIKDKILADVTVQELKVDYEMLYLPAYKAGLRYLAGCAKASKELQAQKKKNLNKQISLLDEETKKLSQVERQIADTSKGR